LKLTDHVNRTDFKRKVSQVFTIILREVDYQDYQNREGGMVYKQIILNAKLQRRRRKEKEEVDDDDVPWTLINYMRTFCAPLQAFLPSFNLTTIPSTSSFEHIAHPQSSPLLFTKDFSALLCRFLVTPRSKNTQDPCYYVHNIISPVVHQLLPVQIDSFS
jgi:hypothetical protein